MKKIINLFLSIEKIVTWQEIYPYVLIPGFAVNYIVYPYVDKVTEVPWMLLIAILSIALGMGSWEDMNPESKKMRKREELPKLWIPLTGSLLVIGIINYSIVAQFVELNPINWENLLMPLAVMVGMTGYRDVKLKIAKKNNDYKRLWIALAAGAVIASLFVLTAIVPFAQKLSIQTYKVEWGYIVAALAILMGVKGVSNKYLALALSIQEKIIPVPEAPKEEEKKE